MHIDIVGAGPPWVLIHGWAMNGGVFAPLVERLQDRYQCWIVDLPGHGLSEERAESDLERSVDWLLARVPAGACWLGWSLGGQVALDAALAAPNHVAALAMIASSPRFVRGEGWPHGVDAAVFRGFAAELRRDYARTIERFMALEVLGDDAAREELRFLRATMASKPPGDPAALDAGLRWLEQRDDRNRLAGLAVPSLWLAGTRDRLVPPAAMRWAAQACGGVYREWACGHAPFLSHADDVAQMLKTWR